MLKKVRMLVAFTVVVMLLVSLSGVASAAGQDRATWQAFPQCKQGSASATFTKVIQVMLANYDSTTHSLVMNHGGYDGIFGSYTKQAVIRFQQLNGLTADGIVGPNTWGKLYDHLSIVGGWTLGEGGFVTLYCMDTSYGYDNLIIGYCWGGGALEEGYPTNSWWVDISGGGMEGNVIMFKS